MKTLGMTTSTCRECRKLIPAKVVTDGRDVFFRKLCPAHGEQQVLIRTNVEEYLHTQRFVKPAWEPKQYSGDASKPCPDGCGFCDRHEQHLCMPIIEITTRCNLACPVCINASGTDEDGDLSLIDFRAMLDRLIASENQIDVLNLSGGEPLLHPEILAFLDEALSRKEIVRVSASTNGLLFLEHPRLIEEFRKRNVVVSLQLDGFSEKPYEILRGRPLLTEKTRILDLLKNAGLTTTLTMTAAIGANETEFRPVLDYLFGNEHVVSLMIQPVALAGRGEGLEGIVGRPSIPDVIHLLSDAGHRAVRAQDFVPLPCSHPLCFSLAFYLMLDAGGSVSVNQLTDAETFMNSLSNRVFYGLSSDEHAALKDMIYNLWSGPAGAVPDAKAVLATLRGLLRKISCSCSSGFDSRGLFTSMERKVKSIFIHAFQDADTFDLARARRCCQSYPQADGTIVPACVNNVIRRKGKHSSTEGAA